MTPTTTIAIVETTLLADLLTHSGLDANQVKTVTQSEQAQRLLASLMDELCVRSSDVSREAIPPPANKKFECKVFESKQSLWLYRAEESWFADTLALAGLAIGLAILEPFSFGISTAALTQSMLHNIVSLTDSRQRSVYRAICELEAKKQATTTETIAQHLNWPLSEAARVLSALELNKQGPIVKPHGRLSGQVSDSPNVRWTRQM